MSAFAKDEEQYDYDAAATRPNQAPSYEGLAQPSFASQYIEASARLPHEHPAVDVSYMPSSQYESRAESGYPSESPFIDAGSRHPAPHFASGTEVTNAVHPSQGTAGDRVILHLRAKFDLTNEPAPPSFAIMFGSKRCEAALQKIDESDDYYNYALTVQVPPFPLTNQWDPTIMLKLRMEDKTAQTLYELDAGKFTYSPSSPSAVYPSNQNVKKRKYSYGQLEDYTEHVAKRAAANRLQAKPRSLSTAYTTPALSPLAAQSSLSNTYDFSSSYISKASDYTPQLAQRSLYAVPSGLPMPQPDVKPQMTQNLPSYAQYGSFTRRSPASVAAQTVRSSVQSSSSNLPTPVLVRATTIPQTVDGAPAPPFNPYNLYPSKAVLKIEGELHAMCDNWTEVEVEAKRRLVMFERSQLASTITTTFRPVTLEDRPPRSTCVSCIYWEEKGEHFITSVDTIHLLEDLVNVRFTVEEKNRIRRNLEGFRPKTVSKLKPDSEAFFKVIMAFPNPKPRNIEKDVKVFPWRVLPYALKKIISKYSASYASTAGVGSRSGTDAPGGLHVGFPRTSGGSLTRESPRSMSSSLASNAYAASMTSKSMSPTLRASAGFEGSAAHGLPMAQRGATGQGMTQWPTAPYQVPHYAPSLRGSWDFGGSLDAPTASATGVPAAAQSMHLQRSDDINSPYQQYGQSTSRV
ncbi:hypothetical protein M011DRAFT_476988 [Sporormia fimetaria CBS 119925]|uniref:DUF7082 domain-containing protein n=1 Tax=Sporormia fimetaria CBS 119925 TaxID=1340428 RepID=A0A6A6VF64_9PLEO|nr:hypothetical protein M011DRAFT_476988 [Sporormia fimetaria CBS 119925]